MRNELSISNDAVSELRSGSLVVLKFVIKTSGNMSELSQDRIIVIMDN